MSVFFAGLPQLLELLCTHPASGNGAPRIGIPAAFGAPEPGNLLNVSSFSKNGFPGSKMKRPLLRARAAVAADAVHSDAGVRAKDDVALASHVLPVRVALGQIFAAFDPVGEELLRVFAAQHAVKFITEFSMVAPDHQALNSVARQ